MVAYLCGLIIGGEAWHSNKYCDEERPKCSNLATVQLCLGSHIGVQCLGDCKEVALCQSVAHRQVQDQL